MKKYFGFLIFALCVINLSIGAAQGESNIIDITDTQYKNESSQGISLDNDKIVQELSSYFSNYYSHMSQGEPIKPGDVLGDIKEIISNIASDKSLGDSSFKSQISGIVDFFQLTQWLYAYLGKDGWAVNIFLSPDGIVNCWLGRRKIESQDTKNIWGSAFSYQFIVIDELLIHDYLYYSTQAKEQVEAGVQNNLIFCNQEAFRNKAAQRWEFLLSRFGSQKHSTYNPSSVDRLRRNFLRLAWGELFLGAIKEEKGREFFIREAAGKFLELAIIHELGHIYADSLQEEDDAILSEMVSILTELRFSPLIYESLNTLLSFAWESPWPVYRQAGQYLLAQFIQEVEVRGLAGNLFKKTGKLVRDQEMLYHLTEAGFREIADKIYQQLTFVTKN